MKTRFLILEALEFLILETLEGFGRRQNVHPFTMNATIPCRLRQELEFSD